VADSPIRNIYQVYSAKYAVRDAKWNNLPLHIFHRPSDTFNLKTMEESMKASLGYYTANFAPYTSKDLKLVQYPDPGTGGVSLPGTIGYSTNFALLNASDQRGFDLPFAVVAHEVAHQWWGHQLVPADAKGALFLSESLAWYSALCVVAKTKGEEQLANLLYAMRAGYYGPRARADVPLLETVDPAKAYRKGPFAMYALREYIGEEKVNLALRNLLSKFPAGKQLFPTSLDFFRGLHVVTPDSLSYLLNDLFAVNTIWDLQARGATVERTGVRQWKVKLKYKAKKERVDEQGNVTPLPMNELIEIGVFKIDPLGKRRPIYLKKHKIISGEDVIELNISEQPSEAGIDPRNLLIDMDPYDNMRRVK
jgi:ABC-2 type transport system permease protein